MVILLHNNDNDDEFVHPHKLPVVVAIVSNELSYHLSQCMMKDYYYP